MTLTKEELKRIITQRHTILESHNNGADFHKSLSISLKTLVKYIDELDTSQKITRKGIINRLDELPDASRDEWISFILRKFGNTFRQSVYSAGYDQGRFDSNMDLRYNNKKETLVPIPVIPQFVVDWYQQVTYETGMDIFDGSSIFKIIYAIKSFEAEGNDSNYRISNWGISNELTEWALTHEEAFIHLLVTGRYTIYEEQTYHLVQHNKHLGKIYLCQLDDGTYDVTKTLDNPNTIVAWTAKELKDMDERGFVQERESE